MHGLAVICLSAFALALLVLNSIHSVRPFGNAFVVYWNSGGLSIYPDFVIAGGLLAMLVLAVLLVVIAGYFFFESSSDEQPSPEAMYDAEARRLQALKRAADAETAYMTSAIARARTTGEYAELDEIAQHDRAIRDLRGRLQ